MQSGIMLFTSEPDVVSKGDFVQSLPFQNAFIELADDRVNFAFTTFESARVISAPLERCGLVDEMFAKMQPCDVAGALDACRTDFGRYESDSIIWRTASENEIFNDPAFIPGPVFTNTFIKLGENRVSLAFLGRIIDVFDVSCRIAIPKPSFSKAYAKLKKAGGKLLSIFAIASLGAPAVTAHGFLI